MPSSLGSNHSFTLVFSTWPPVSVLGYGSACIKIRRFSWKRAPLCSHCRSSMFCLRSEDMCPDFPKAPPHDNKVNPIILREYNTPSLRHIHVESWNINHVSIESGFRILLGPTNPQLIFMAAESLAFRCAGISPALRLLVPAFSLLYAPLWVTPSASAHRERSPTDHG